MLDHVPFSVLQKFLLGLGFQHKQVPESHQYFKHSEAGALIMLRLYRPEEEVRQADLVLVRRVLDDYRLVERDRFESLLQEQVLAG